MFKYYSAIVILFFTISFYSCCSHEVKEISSNTSTPMQSMGQDIQINKSLIDAEVKDIFHNSAQDYVIKAKVIKVKPDNSYPSIAVSGEEYLLSPSYIIGENKMMNPDSEINKRLVSLAKVKPGDKFTAEIFLDRSKGWFIKDVIQ